MNETLSSLIAFVGFLIVFSMLIQSVQEALKNLFKLKSGVWEQFFITLYETDFKSENKDKLKPEPFWKRVTSGKFVGEFDQRLKRLRTVILKTDDLFKQIRKVLGKIAAIDEDEFKTEGKTDLKFDQLQDMAAQVLGLKIDAMIRLYDKSKKGGIAAGLSRLRTEAAELDHIRDKEVGEIKEFCKNLSQTIRDLEKNIATYKAQIESKADAWLVQLQGEYKKNMLKWTLVISLFAVLFLNADAFSIYQHFAVNQEARNIIEAAVGNASSMEEIDSERLNTILSDIHSQKLISAKEGVRQLAEQLKTNFQTLKYPDGEKKAEEILTAVWDIPTDDTDLGAKGLTNQYEKLITLYFTLHQKTIAGNKDTLASTGLPLGWTADWKKIHPKECSWEWLLILKKISGLSLTIFLVAFGAPFWQNVMNALIGLRQVTRIPGNKKQ